MYQQKIGICFARYYDIPLKEELKMIKDVGFDAVSLSWRAEAELRESADVANALGLELQSLHAPFGNAANLWSEDEDTREVAQNEILAVVDVCASLQTPIAVVHVWIGFDYTFEKERLNYKSFDTIVRYAREKQVRIAFENTSGWCVIPQGGKFQSTKNLDKTELCVPTIAAEYLSQTYYSWEWHCEN